MLFLYITYPYLYVTNPMSYHQFDMYRSSGMLCVQVAYYCIQVVRNSLLALHTMYVRHSYSCTNMGSRQRVLNKSYVETCFKGLICASGVLSNCSPNVAFLPYSSLTSVSCVYVSFITGSVDPNL